ncbi:MAG: inositol monophosphatase family protein [Candidatus Nanohaloarchaea archaeon]|nr:inositol monophosphatase family protein [Candidatus Nanohaloarchaea archaeon]
MEFEQELDVAVTAAERAAEVMARYRREGFEVERKTSYTDLVTEADRECQEVIVETIQEEFPGDGFLGEEDGLRPDGEDRVWVIDPIDGTTNFAHGFPWYCSSIGLRVDGERTVGVVNVPPQDELFTAVRGEGAFMNGEPISPSGVKDIRDGLIVARIADWSGVEGDLKGLESRLLNDLLSTPTSFRRPGAAAVDLCNVAAGRVDGQLLVVINEWDVAAGALVLEEAGGTARIQDAVFDDYIEIVSSNGHIQDELEEVFDRHVRG